MPVVYNYFESKQQLHRRLLERHFTDLRGVWHDHFVGEDPPQQRMARAFDAWFAYVEAHPSPCGGTTTVTSHDNASSTRQ